MCMRVFVLGGSIVCLYVVGKKGVRFQHVFVVLAAIFPEAGRKE